jgi:hypothetical protein
VSRASCFRQEFILPERDINMSEQEKPKSSFMQELDQWSEENIFRPLFGTDPNQDDWAKVEAQVKKAVRAKVLESYRNGQHSAKVVEALLPNAREARIDGKWIKGGRYNAPNQK